MQVSAISYDPAVFPTALYESGLTLVDSDSVLRIRRFYRREDACRTLIGRLLPRLLARKNGIPTHLIKFKVTDAGKPYFDIPELAQLVFNVSHDNHLVVMASKSGSDHLKLGVDVMKVALPRQESFLSFVNTMKEQLTKLEQRALFSVTQDEGLKRFYWMWTVKEAYTKALGIGLGFDFARVEYDIEAEMVHVDGKPTLGWRFNKFVVTQPDGIYQGVVAEFTGDDVQRQVQREMGDISWLDLEDAVSFVHSAIPKLS